MLWFHNSQRQQQCHFFSLKISFPAHTCPNTVQIMTSLTIAVSSSALYTTGIFLTPVLFQALFKNGNLLSTSDGHVIHICL